MPPETLDLTDCWLHDMRNASLYSRSLRILVDMIGPDAQTPLDAQRKCPICLQDDEDIDANELGGWGQTRCPCEAFFHYDCLHRWTTVRVGRCLYPCCRRVMPKSKSRMMSCASIQSTTATQEHDDDDDDVRLAKARSLAPLERAARHAKRQKVHTGQTTAGGEQAQHVLAPMPPEPDDEMLLCDGPGADGEGVGEDGEEVVVLHATRVAPPRSCTQAAAVGQPPSQQLAGCTKCRWSANGCAQCRKRGQCASSGGGGPSSAGGGDGGATQGASEDASARPRVDRLRRSGRGRVARAATRPPSGQRAARRPARRGTTLFARMADASRWTRAPAGETEHVAFEGLPWLRVAPVPQAGRGLLAARAFPRGALLVRFRGKSCTRASGKASEHVFARRGGACLDGADAVAGMLNWSRKPNAELRESDGVYAREPIAEGDELTIPYGSGFWRVHRLPQIAVIGSGVSVCPSSLGAHTGMGLRASWPFETNHYITEYAGKRIMSGSDDGRTRRAFASDKYAAAALKVQTHIACCAPADLGPRVYVDGIRTPQPGQGGGSFAQHSDNPNAKLVCRGGRIFLQALQPISPGDEIYIDYGVGKAVAFGESRYVQVKNIDGRYDVKVVPVEKVVAGQTWECSKRPEIAWRVERVHGAWATLHPTATLSALMLHSTATLSALMDIEVLLTELRGAKWARIS